MQVDFQDDLIQHVTDGGGRMTYHELLGFAMKIAKSPIEIEMTISMLILTGQLAREADMLTVPGEY